MFRLGLLLVLGAAACAAPDRSLDAAAKARIDAEVREYLARIAADLSREGPHGWLPHFIDDGRFSMANDGAVAFPDLAAAAAAVNALDPAITRMDLEWVATRVEPLTGNLAAVGSSYRELLVGVDGSETRFAGYVTMVVARTERGWRIQHLHWSVDPKMPGGAG